MTQPCEVLLRAVDESDLEPGAREGEKVSSGVMALKAYDADRELDATFHVDANGARHGALRKPRRAARRSGTQTTT